MPARLRLGLRHAAGGHRRGTGAQGHGDRTRRAGPALELVARKAGERLSALRVLATAQSQAELDPLTGVPNRRTIDNQAHELLASGAPFAVGFADLDHFKSVNDTYGHEVGDQALRLFAKVLRDNIRPADMLGRYGGEEFLVLFPDCTVPDACEVAERVRAQLARHLDGANLPAFTVTFGIAGREPGESFADTVSRADRAMMDGKTGGRDRVVAARHGDRDVVAPPLSEASEPDASARHNGITPAGVSGRVGWPEGSHPPAHTEPT